MYLASFTQVLAYCVAHLRQHGQYVARRELAVLLDVLNQLACRYFTIETGADVQRSLLCIITLGVLKPII